MENITEILGEKKISGGSNTDLKMRVLFCCDDSMVSDNNVFYKIDNYQQYIKEKNSCTKYRFYGKINSIINYNIGGNNTIKKNVTQFNVEKTNLELNSENWILVLLKSKELVDINGFNRKGFKTILRKSGNDSLFTLELGMGLPAKYYYQEKLNPNTCLLFPYGHNFRLNDTVLITDTLKKIPDGLYTITSVSYNKIFLNILSPLLESDSLARDAEASGLMIQKKQLKHITEEVMNVTNLITPEVYVKKVISNEVLEYYIKPLEVIGIVGGMDDCGFSCNYYGNDVKIFTVDQDIDIKDLVDNKNNPISSVYLGIIKKTNIQFRNQVDSNFANIVEYTAPNSGLELISTNKIKVGDLFFHSLCEYSTENLTETEIMSVKHSFTHKDIVFSYQPFYEIPIRYQSPDIEESDQLNDIPAHAVKSRLRDKYIWRNYYDSGVSDQDGGGLDHPYINDNLYVFKDVSFFVTTNKRSTTKVTLRQNDINGNVEYKNEHYDLIKDFIYVENITEEVPYQKFNDAKC